MFGFEHTIAKKYYGTIFESSLAHLAGGVCLSCCCPTRSNPRMFLGLSLRGAVRPPLLKELLGCTHRDAIGVKPSWPGWGCSPCSLWLPANRWALPYLGLAGEEMLSLSTEHPLMHPSKHGKVRNMTTVVQFGQSLFWSKWNSYK